MPIESLFFQTVALVNEPPGSLVYHLVLLFALEAAALLALARWRQSHQDHEARLAFGLAAIFAVQLAAFSVAVLAALGILDSLILLPPMDRAVSALTLITLIWLFAVPEPERAGDVVAAGAVAVTVIGLGLTAVFWAQDVAAGASYYNGSPQETAWELGQLAVLALGLITVALRRKTDWPLGIALLAILLIGHVIHYFFPLAGANMPGAERLARIVALPLLTALVFRPARPAAVVSHHVEYYPTRPPEPVLPAVSEPVASEAASASSLTTMVDESGRRKWALDPKAMVALISVSTASTTNEATQIVAMAVARAFLADLCLLIAPPDVTGKASIATAFNLIGEKFLRPASALPTSLMPEFSVAFNRREAVLLNMPEHEVELSLLSDAIGVEHPGPALVVPLIDVQDGLMGALALVSPFAQRPWTSEEQNLLMAIVEPIAAAIDKAERSSQLLAEAERQQTQAAQFEQEVLAAQAANAEVTSNLERLQAELYETHAEMERQRQETDELVREMQVQQAAASGNAELIQTVEDLHSQLQAAQIQAAEAERLQQELDSVLERLKGLSTVEDDLEEAQAQLTAAQQRLSQLDRLASDLSQAQEQLQLEAQHRQQLHRELEGTRAELRRVTERQGAVGAEKAASGAVLVAAQQTLQTLQSRFNEQTAQLASARAELGQHRERVTALQSELEAARGGEAAGGQTRVLVSQLSSSMEVIASLSQDLRQPMSSIVGYSDLLMGESVGILGALQRKFLERIKASCERMGALLDDLIRVTALDSGKLELTRESLDVVKIVEDAILGVGAQFREKGINLRLDIADDLPTVSADKDALRQVLGHLLNNAGSASAIDGEVTLSVQREQEQPRSGEPIPYLFISVRDSGGGIAPDDQPRVFSRLYRADAPLIAGLGDTGVGLSIAKALVEAHAGRIWVNSEMGQGSTFCVLLPVNGTGPLGGNGSGPH